MSGLTGQLFSRSEQGELYRPTRGREMPRGDEAVTAVVTRTAQHGNGAHRPSGPDRHRDRAARRLHKTEPAGTDHPGSTVGFIHLRWRQEGELVISRGARGVHVAHWHTAGACQDQILATADGHPGADNGIRQDLGQ